MVESTKAHIVIVDDDPAAAALLRDALEDRYRIDVYGDGASALAQLDERQIPALFLLDVNMRGVSGFEILSQLRQQPATADVPVIFTTNESALEQEIYAFSLGANDYVLKPVMIDVLREKIARLLCHGQRLTHARQTAVRAQRGLEFEGGWRSFCGEQTQASILVVDDNPADRILFEDCLSDDYRLHFADSGEAALAAATEDGARFDLILLDVVLSDISGYEVLERLRTLPSTRDTPVIFASGRTRGAQIVSALRRGAADYFTKPCRPGLIGARVKQHLARDLRCRFFEAHA